MAAWVFCYNSLDRTRGKLGSVFRVVGLCISVICYPVLMFKQDRSRFGLASSWVIIHDKLFLTFLIKCYIIAMLLILVFSLLSGPLFFWSDRDIVISTYRFLKTLSKVAQGTQGQLISILMKQNYIFIFRMCGLKLRTEFPGNQCTQEVWGTPI